MSKFYGKFDIVSTDLRIILSNFVATDVYALFLKSFKINCDIHVQNKGGSKAILTMLKKMPFWWMMASLIQRHWQWEKVSYFKHLVALSWPAIIHQTNTKTNKKTKTTTYSVTSAILNVS